MRSGSLLPWQSALRIALNLWMMAGNSRGSGVDFKQFYAVNHLARTLECAPQTGSGAPLGRADRPPATGRVRHEGPGLARLLPPHR